MNIKLKDLEHKISLVKNNDFDYLDMLYREKFKYGTKDEIIIKVEMSQKPRHPEKVNKPINPIKKKPEWIRSKIVDSKIFFQTKQVVNQNNLVTVCQEANCPNITECWSKKHATFMIMGDTCTRACAFCDVKTGKPTDLDIFEPAKIAKAVKNLKFKTCCYYFSR